MSVTDVLARLNQLPLWKRQVNLWGFRMQATTLDRLVYLYLNRAGYLGGELRALFEDRIKPGMRVLDIGANSGLFAILFSRLVGDSGEVLAFEPDPELYAALEANCRLNSASNVRCYNLAAGSRAGEMVLSRSLLNAGDNRLSSERRREPTRPVVVKVARIDEIAHSGAVDFVKIDVQGWEAEVLDGMNRLLSQNARLQICLEYWPRGLRNAGADPAKLLATLTERGFELFGVSRAGCKPLAEIADWPRQDSRWYTNVYAVARS